MHTTDKWKIGWLKNELADYQQQLASIEAEAAMPLMWEGYRQDLLDRQKACQDAIAIIESRLPCETLLNVVDDELYAALLQYYPKITRHTEVVRVSHDLVHNGEFYWQPIKPSNVLDYPPSPFIELEHPVRVQFTEFAKDGHKPLRAAYLESHDTVFVVAYHRL